MNHVKFNIAFYPKVFGLSICFEKMLLTSNYKYRFDMQILWIHLAILFYNKYAPKF